MDELHKLLITTATNYAPIRIIKSIKLATNNILMQNLDRIIRMLEALCVKSFRDEHNECPNDVLSFKAHYYKYIFEYLRSQKKKLVDNNNKELNEAKRRSDRDIEEKLFDVCIKYLLTEEQVLNLY